MSTLTKLAKHRSVIAAVSVFALAVALLPGTVSAKAVGETCVKDLE